MKTMEKIRRIVKHSGDRELRLEYDEHERKEREGHRLLADLSRECGKAGTLAELSEQDPWAQRRIGRMISEGRL